jgi:anti-sigma factor RsiW
MTHSPQPPHDPIDEREWALQEQALRAERLKLDPAADAKLQRYRTVVQALREPLDATLPDDFAAQVARKARQPAASTMRLELWTSGILLGVLGAMLMALVMVYGASWLQLMRTALAQNGLSSPWLAALIAGVALPVLLGRWTPRPRDPTHH